jgi:murein DD-endopeptidase MepM/ murein hydrolase activator NlpD
MTRPIPSIPRPTSPFGKKGPWWAAGYHTGEDYAAPRGTPVLASRAGVVIGTGNQWGSAYGWQQVIIESTGPLGRKVRHGYMHMMSTSVYAGMKVRAGQMVGRVGDQGNATGTHLHYEERTAPFGYWNHRRPMFPSQGRALLNRVLHPRRKPAHQPPVDGDRWSK